jgi:hypothetical protein
VVDLPNKANSFVNNTQIPLTYIVVLNEGVTGGAAEAEDASVYASELGLAGFPVTADPSGQLYTMTQWTGQIRPGKCALAPDMTILACYVGQNDAEGFAAIEAHAAAQ